MRTPLPLLLFLLAGCSEPPPPGVTPPQCGTGELDDGGVCVPADCGTGTFGGLVPGASGPTWYVRAGAEEGDGSEERPFGRITTALEEAAASPGGRVLIAAGRYPEHLSFNRGHDGLELIGRCNALVVVDGEGLAAPTVSIFASQVVVRRMTITGGRPGIIAGEVPGAPGLVLRGNDLRIEDNGGYGVLATGSGVLLDLAESRVRGVLPTNELSPARGIGVEQGARFVGLGLQIEEVTGIGVAVGAGEAELEEVQIGPGRAQDDGTLGRGVWVRGGSLVLRRSDIAAQPEWGAKVEGGGSLRFEDGTLAGAGGVELSEGSSLFAVRALLQSGSGEVLSVAGNNSLADLEDSELARGPGESSAMRVRGGATLRAEGMTVSGASGLWLSGEDTLGVLTDTDVQGPGPSEGLGIGLLVSDGAEVVADDLSVLDSSGPGLASVRGGVLRCVACLVEGAGFAGALADGGELRLEGGAVRASLPHPLHGGGVGAQGGGGGKLQIDDTLFSDHPHAGVALRGPGTWRIASAIVERCGTGGDAPGLLASEGTGFWQGSGGPGLFVFDTTFRELPNDAMLFDGATGTVSASNFAQVGQLEVYTQNCAGVSPPDVAESLAGNDCVGPPRDLGPALSWPAPPVP